MEALGEGTADVNLIGQFGKFCVWDCVCECECVCVCLWKEYI
jgi:hypothetical protein